LQTPSWKREPARAVLSRPCPVRDGRALPKQPPDRAPDVSPSDAPIRVATSRPGCAFASFWRPGSACAPVRARDVLPAEVSRDRGRGGFRPPGAFRRDCSRTKASPRPDPLGHLLSRARCDAGWRPAPRRRPRWRLAAYELTTPTRSRGPAQTTRFRGAVSPGCGTSLPALPVRSTHVVAPASGPPPTLLREEERDPLRPRCLPSMDIPSVDGCLGRPRPGVGGTPQVVPNLWSIRRRLCVSRGILRP